MRVHGSLDVKKNLMVGGAFDRPFNHYQDQKPSGTVGGALTAGAWNERTLNTELHDGIGTGLTGSRITLGPGIYHVEASAPGFRVGVHKLRIVDTIFNQVNLVGQSVASSAASSGHEVATVVGRFTITQTTDIALEHFIENNASTSDAGVPTSASGVVEVYAELLIWQISPTDTGEIIA